MRLRRPSLGRRLAGTSRGGLELQDLGDVISVIITVSTNITEELVIVAIEDVHLVDVVEELVYVVVEVEKGRLPG